MNDVHAMQLKIMKNFTKKTGGGEPEKTLLGRFGLETACSVVSGKFQSSFTVVKIVSTVVRRP